MRFSPRVSVSLVPRVSVWVQLREPEVPSVSLVPSLVDQVRLPDSVWVSVSPDASASATAWEAVFVPLRPVVPLTPTGPAETLPEPDC